MTCKMSWSVQILAVVVVLVCVVDCLPLDTNTPSRLKRGFRSNVGDRLAHGFGKRGYTSHVSDELARDGTNWFDEESLDTPISSAADFSKLVVSNPELARVLIAKFVDINGDEVVTSDELFRPVK